MDARCRRNGSDSLAIDFSASTQQLWRRLVFNFLITNVDDHLQNIGFLSVDKNRWQLSPAFDLNPFPDKDRESKTWLSEDTGPIPSVAQLLGQAARLQLKEPQATAVLAEVVDAVKPWRDVAQAPGIGLAKDELEDFAPAFEHAGLDEALALLGSRRHGVTGVSEAPHTTRNLPASLWPGVASSTAAAGAATPQKIEITRTNG